MHANRPQHNCVRKNVPRLVVTRRLCILLASLTIALAGVAACAGPPSEADAGQPTFTESIFCGICHSNSPRATAMRDAQGRPVAPYNMWRSSMMANSARDPFWRAVVSAEVAATPSQKELIEATCNRCHAPMVTHPPASPDGQVFTYLHQRDARALLGLDGVSCTVCHQITAEGLGTDDSYSGKFTIGKNHVIFGPHADPHAAPMKQLTGYTPQQGQHILRSALCATCHNLVTDTLDADGTANGHKLVEQSPYSEWRNSVYNDEVDAPHEDARSCQSCHMPVTDEDGRRIETRIARNPGGRDFPPIQPRTRYGRHVFLGVNTLVAGMLRDNPEGLNVTGLNSSFEESIARHRRFIQTATARVTIGDVQRQGGKLRVPVRVENLAGHKLPTSYPTRRVWLRLEVLDAAGHTRFVSGAFNKAGELIDEDGQPLPSEAVGGPIQPHRRRISRPSEVQVYESVMGDKDGQPTFTLLRGAAYLKDNRILPRGWKADHPDAGTTTPVGVAGDTDFADGADVITYDVPMTSQGPVEVRASLHLQVIGARDAAELFTVTTPEVEQFRELYEQADRTPETLAAAAKKL